MTGLKYLKLVCLFNIEDNYRANFDGIHFKTFKFLFNLNDCIGLHIFQDCSNDRIVLAISRYLCPKGALLFSEIPKFGIMTEGEHFRVYLDRSKMPPLFNDLVGAIEYQFCVGFSINIVFPSSATSFWNFLEGTLLSKAIHGVKAARLFKSIMA